LTSQPASQPVKTSSSRFQANVCQVSHLTRYAVSIHIFRLN
jgi:hypothetical protein